MVVNVIIIIIIINIIIVIVIVIVINSINSIVIVHQGTHSTFRLLSLKAGFVHSLTNNSTIWGNMIGPDGILISAKVALP